MTIMDSQSRPEPSPMSDQGNMSTDVIDSFKRAFQEMATEREGLLKKVDNYHSQEQILDDLRNYRNEFKNNLDESRAGCKKELPRLPSSPILPFSLIWKLFVHLFPRNRKKSIPSKSRWILIIRKALLNLGVVRRLQNPQC